MGKSILIVEDETIVAMELSRRLVAMGHRVIGPVGASKPALELAQSEAIDLALLDVRLRHGDSGTHLALQLRELHAVPFIFLTAYSDEDTLQQIKRCEPLGYLLKPLDERSLWVTIETALHTHEMSRRRAQAERARQRSDALYRTILDSSHDAILSVDADARITVYNQGAEEIFGYPASEALGCSVSLLLPGWLQAACPVSSHEPPPLDCRRPRGIAHVQGRRHDGSEFPAEVSVSAVQVGDELVRTAIVRDLQERRALETRVAQAERFEALGRLAGGIAHDFNNMLTAILGYARLLEATFEASDPRRSDIYEIQGAVERAGKLVRELLTYSSRQRLKQEPVHVNAVIGGLQSLLRTLIGSSIVLRVGLAAELPLVLTDAGKLEQIIMNLVLNARDASALGGPVTIDTRIAGPEDRAALRDLRSSQQAVVISVRDEGVGMDEATRQRIFEPFFTTKQERGGTGLGLATAYSAVRQSGGEILVDSALGRGTLVRVVLPAAELQRAAPRSVSAPESGAPLASVLLVEDEPLVRELTARLLRDCGYRVFAAAHGEEAWLLAQSRGSEIDMLLSDVVMPGIDGVELATRWRASFPHKPVLLMSAYTEHARTGRLDSLGVPVLEKPFEPEALKRAVQGLFSLVPAPDAIATD